MDDPAYGAYLKDRHLDAKREARLKKLAAHRAAIKAGKRVDPRKSGVSTEEIAYGLAIDDYLPEDK